MFFFLSSIFVTYGSYILFKVQRDDEILDPKEKILTVYKNSWNVPKLLALKF